MFLINYFGKRKIVL